MSQYKKIIKNKPFDFKKILLIGAVPTTLGAIGWLAVSLATYIELPKRVEASEKRVTTIEDYIRVQQTANDLMQKLVNKEEEIIYSQDKKYYWNSEKKIWRSVKQLRKMNGNP